MKEKLCLNCKHRKGCIVIERVEDVARIGFRRYAFNWNDIAKICQYYEEVGDGKRRPPNCLYCKEDCPTSGTDRVLFSPDECDRYLFDDEPFEEEDEADWVK